MKLILTITCPPEELKKRLAEDGITIEEFCDAAREDFKGLDANDLLPGATAELRFEDLPV